MARLRVTSAYVVWTLCCGVALLLAGGALLVALKADASAAPWSWWLTSVDAVTPGWFQRPAGGAVGSGDVSETLVRWGAAALALLVGGAVLQWVFRPRRF